jgi:hypothetical protein
MASTIGVLVSVIMFLGAYESHKESAKPWVRRPIWPLSRENWLHVALVVCLGVYAWGGFIPKG